jgi:hypothetical protein
VNSIVILKIEFTQIGVGPEGFGCLSSEAMRHTPCCGGIGTKAARPSAYRHETFAIERHRGLAENEGFLSLQRIGVRATIAAWMRS